MAHSHSLPTSDFCSPPPSTPLWHALCVGVDLITMSFFKVLLCLLVDNVSIQSKLRALQVILAHYLLPHPVPLPQIWCQKRGHVGSMSVLMVHFLKCVVVFKMHTAEWAVGVFGAWGFGFLSTVYSRSHSMPLLLCKSPWLKFSSLPLLTL